MSTNKPLLKKGLKFIFGSLPLMFLGPIIILNAFGNQKHALYYLVLTLGILTCGSALYLVFKGLNLISKAIFNES